MGISSLQIFVSEWIEFLFVRKVRYLVKYGDVSGLAKKIDEVLDDPGNSSSMVARGEGYIRKNLSWEHIARSHVALYQEVINR